MLILSLAGGLMAELFTAKTESARYGQDEEGEQTWLWPSLFYSDEAVSLGEGCENGGHVEGPDAA